MSDTPGQVKVDPIDGQPIGEHEGVFDNLEDIEVEVSPIEKAPALEPEPDQSVQAGPELQGTLEGDSEPDEPQGERPWDPRDLPDHYSSPEDAYGAATFFQSQYDKAQSRNRDLEKKLENHKSAEPIVEAIMSDPALLNLVSSHLNGSSSSGQATVNGQGQSAGKAAAEPEQSLKAPTPPEKPADLDPYSEEYQSYLDKREKYLEDKAAYEAQKLDQKYSQISQRLEQVEQERQQRVQQAQYQQQRQSHLQELQHVYKLPAQKAEQFLSDLENGFFSQPDSIGVLARAWEMAQTPTADQVRQQRQRDAVEQRAGQNRTTLAATEGGKGDSGKQPGFEDQVGEALEAEYGTVGRWF